MKISDFIIKEAIEVDFKAAGKGSAIKRMCKNLALSTKVTDIKTLTKDILSREEIESTGIGDGIALPHARTKGVSEPIISIAISKKGIDFDSLDSRPVNILFFIAVPENQSKQLLKFLAKITQLLKRPEVRSNLLSVKNSDQIIDILKD